TEIYTLSRHDALPIYEGPDRSDTSDHAYGAEGISVEQQAAQGLTFEHRVNRCRQLGIGGGGLCLCAALGGGKGAADRLEVHRDEVICVRLGLGTGEKLLAGILVEERADLRAGRGRSLRREEDLLLAELGLHLVADE